MTALGRYVRLEALGIWTEAAGVEPREVVVAFRDASLVLTDLADRPLGHWALAGIQPIGAAEGATVYAMTRDGEETLTIGDPEMIAAIAAVSRLWPADDVPRPAERGWRLRLAPLMWLVLLAALVAYGPGLLRDQAARMVPPEQAEEFGQRMLLDLIAAHGPACTDPAGLRALGRLSQRALGGVPLAVLGLGATTGVAILPGPLAVLNREVISAAADPQAVAALVDHALGTDPQRAPVAAVMQAAGPLASLRYILTGRLSESALALAAESALLPPAGDGLPVPADRSSPLLSDRDWVALRAICG